MGAGPAEAALPHSGRRRSSSPRGSRPRPLGSSMTPGLQGQWALPTAVPLPEPGCCVRGRPPLSPRAATTGLFLGPLPPHLLVTGAMPSPTWPATPGHPTSHAYLPTRGPTCLLQGTFPDTCPQRPRQVWTRVRSFLPRLSHLGRVGLSLTHVPSGGVGGLEHSRCSMKTDGMILNENCVSSGAQHRNIAVLTARSQLCSSHVRAELCPTAEQEHGLPRAYSCLPHPVTSVGHSPPGHR